MKFPTPKKNTENDLEKYTDDCLFQHSYIIRQSKNGYRFSIDAILLAHFTSPKANSYVLDLGTGCGIIPLILAHRHKPITVTGIEIQKSLYELAKHNVSTNNLESTVTLIHSDYNKQPSPFGNSFFDMIVSNPPFTKQNAGRLNPVSEKAIARHEIKTTVEDLIKTASTHLAPQGEFNLIYPMQRKDELITKLRNDGFQKIVTQKVYPLKHKPAKLILVKCNKSDFSQITQLPPLYIYEPDGSYSDDINQMLQP